MEARAVRIELRFMAPASVIEGGAATEPDAHGAFDAAHPAAKMSNPGRIRANPHGNKIFQFGDAIGKQEPCHQYVGGRPIELFLPHLIADGANLEAASLIVIQNCSKDAWRVEVGVTILIDGAIHANQGDGAHVADDLVILDGLIRHGWFPQDGPTSAICNKRFRSYPTLGFHWKRRGRKESVPN